MFGYAFRDLVIVDRRLQFGWRNSPGLWCLFSAALAHSHVTTSFHNAVVIPFGRAVTRHVQLARQHKANPPSPFPRGTAFRRGTGGVSTRPFFTRMYVDNAVLVEPQCYMGGER